MTADAPRIFVFGSNRAGIHGAGSALHARTKCAAVLGVGEGRTGQSFAIPTKDEHLRVLPLKDIYRSVSKFIFYAAEHPELQFDVVDIGCGLAGYKVGDIAPMFKQHPPNVHFLGELGKLLT